MIPRRRINRSDCDGYTSLFGFSRSRRRNRQRANQRPSPWHGRATDANHRSLFGARTRFRSIRTGGQLLISESPSCGCDRLILTGQDLPQRTIRDQLANRRLLLWFVVSIADVSVQAESTHVSTIHERDGERDLASARMSQHDTRHWEKAILVEDRVDLNTQAAFRPMAKPLEDPAIGNCHGLMLTRLACREHAMRCAGLVDGVDHDNRGNPTLRQNHLRNLQQFASARRIAGDAGLLDRDKRRVLVRQQIAYP